jgi:hypothetical protein
MPRSAALLLIFQPTVRQVAQQRVPSCEGIADGPGERALAADPFQDASSNSFNSFNRGRAYWMRAASPLAEAHTLRDDYTSLDAAENRAADSFTVPGGRYVV